MEPLPRGANFLRAKTLWEIGLHIAGHPHTVYGGNRDMCGPPGDMRRVAALRAQEIDLVLDEGLAAGYRLLALEEPILRQLEAIGWRRVVIPAGRFPHLKADLDVPLHPGAMRWYREHGIAP